MGEGAIQGGIIDGKNNVDIFTSYIFSYIDGLICSPVAV